MRSVVIRTNELGECVEVLELKTLTEEQIANYKKESDKVKAREKKVAESLAEDNDIKSVKDYYRAIILAKQQYNELVETGEFSYNAEFENAYDVFIKGGEFDKTKAPMEYLAILERIK